MKIPVYSHLFPLHVRTSIPAHANLKSLESAGDKERFLIRKNIRESKSKVFLWDVSYSIYLHMSFSSFYSCLQFYYWLLAEWLHIVYPEGKLSSVKLEAKWWRPKLHLEPTYKPVSNVYKWRCFSQKNTERTKRCHKLKCTMKYSYSKQLCKKVEQKR